jgi:hypothetical protein
LITEGMQNTVLPFTNPHLHACGPCSPVRWGGQLRTGKPRPPHRAPCTASKCSPAKRNEGVEDGSLRTARVWSPARRTGKPRRRAKGRTASRWTRGPRRALALEWKPPHGGGRGVGRGGLGSFALPSKQPDAVRGCALHAPGSAGALECGLLGVHKAGEPRRQEQMNALQVLWEM